MFCSTGAESEAFSVPERQGVFRILLRGGESRPDCSRRSTVKSMKPRSGKYIRSDNSHFSKSHLPTQFHIHFRLQEIQSNEILLSIDRSILHDTKAGIYDLEN